MLVAFSFDEQGQIPDVDRAIAAGGCQTQAIRAEGHRASRIFVFQRQETRSRRYLPHLDRLIVGRTRQEAAIGTEANIPYVMSMAEKAAKFPARPDIPEPDGLIIAGAGKVLAVRAELHVNDLIRVPLEKLNLLSQRHIPQTNGTISTATGDPFAVRVKAHSVNMVGVPAK